MHLRLCTRTGFAHAPDRNSASTHLHALRDLRKHTHCHASDAIRLLRPQPQQQRWQVLRCKHGRVRVCASGAYEGRGKVTRCGHQILHSFTCNACTQVCACMHVCATKRVQLSNSLSLFLL